MHDKERKVKVTLVHGTWARNAPWTMEGAPLYQALTAKGYEVCQHGWSSGNRFSARKDGAEKLKTKLHDERGVDHFIIAHSHGGNLAIRAIDGDDSLVKGLICLNTPFIDILGRDKKVFEAMIMYLTLGASVIPLGLWLGSNLIWWQLVLLYLGICLIAALGGLWFESLYKFIQNKGKAFHFKPLETTPLFCLNTTDDEAFSGLSFFVAAQNFLFLFVGRVMVFGAVFGSIIAFLLVFECIPFIMLPWEWLTNEGVFTRELLSLNPYGFVSSEPSTWIMGLVKLLVLYLISAMYYFATYSLLMLVLLTGLSLIVTLTQGFFAPLSGLFNRFMVNLKPLKSTNTKFVEKRGDETNMRHSSLYNDPETIEEILYWIDSKR